MYRNCVYNGREKCIHLFTWDAQGNRVRQDLDYNPYLYLEDRNGDELSIYGTKLSKKEFRSGFDRTKWVQQSGVKRLFENLPPAQQFLIDNYWMDCENDDFAKNQLKVMFLDIETYSKEFPDVETAPHTINLITVYDSISKKYRSFGLKPYESKRKDVVYTHCKGEENLLKEFLKYYRSDYPDVLVGWNNVGFDIPYIINRISNVLGEDYAADLSPIGRYYERIDKTAKFGSPMKYYVVEGVSSIDYMVMYKKFAMEKQESYKLDYIAEVELGQNKISYEGQLWELADRDWNTFVEYNIQDVELLVNLDAELQYIDLLRFISYLGLCDMEKAIKTVGVINGAVAVRARQRGEKIPTFVREHSSGKIPGGFVAEPVAGLHENIVSFDANSLYPSVMISLNLSPETKLGRIEKIKDDQINFYHTSGRTYEFTPATLKKYIESENATLTKNKFLFSQKKKGIMPEFLDFLYTKRKEMKAKMIESKKRLKEHGNELDNHTKSELETLVKQLDTYQNAYKITLNSTYGYCANKFAPLGDMDIGASVTLTGQAAIKKSNDLLVDFLKTKNIEIPESQLSKVLIYNDTDSCYISLKCVEKIGIEAIKDGKITPEFYALCEEVENYINVGMGKWAKKNLNSSDSRFVFKREAICDKGILIGKKYYVLHVLDSEGIPVNEFKYKGVDVVKTTMSKELKPDIKNIIETLMMEMKLDKTNKLFNEVYDKFLLFDVRNISKIQGVNKYEEYSAKAVGLQMPPKCPIHVRAAYYHDFMVDKLQLGSKYEKFKSGDKVRFVYLKTPNQYGMNVIAYKAKFPPEFLEIFQVDYEKQFNKIIFAAISRFYEAVGWTLRKPSENLKCEILDLFSL